MTRNQSRQASAARFSEQARAFIAWADGSASDEPMTARIALRSVLALYAAALALPQPWSVGVNTQDAPAAPEPERLQAVRHRAAAVPLQHYGEIFSPLLVPPEPPVVGDLADDLADTYRDVALGQALYEAGRCDDAIWQWGSSFQTHWGQHAASAIRALHCYLSQEDPSGLLSQG
jgi:hypothetical protein